MMARFRKTQMLLVWVLMFPVAIGGVYLGFLLSHEIFRWKFFWGVGGILGGVLAVALMGLWIERIER